MKRESVVKATIKAFSRILMATVCVFCIMVGLQTVILPQQSVAIAIPIDADSADVNRSSETNRSLTERVQRSLEDAEYAADDRLKYRDESAGKSGELQQTVDATGQQLRRKANQAQSKLQNQIDRAKSGTESAVDDAGNVLEEAVDSVRNFFD